MLNEFEMHRRIGPGLLRRLPRANGPNESTKRSLGDDMCNRVPDLLVVKATEPARPSFLTMHTKGTGPGVGVLLRKIALTDGPHEDTMQSFGHDILNRVLDLLASGSNGASPYQA